MIIFLVICLFISIIINCLFCKLLLKTSKELLTLDKELKHRSDFIDICYNVLQTVHNNLKRVSNHPTISNEPIVEELIKIIQHSKNEVESLISSIDVEEDKKDHG